MTSILVGLYVAASAAGIGLLGAMTTWSCGWPFSPCYAPPTALTAIAHGGSIALVVATGWVSGRPGARRWGWGLAGLAVAASGLVGGYHALHPGRTIFVWDGPAAVTPYHVTLGGAALLGIAAGSVPMLRSAPVAAAFSLVLCLATLARIGW